MLSRFRTLALSHLLLLVASPAMAAAGSATLRGSPASMARQHEVAEEQAYSFVRTPAEVRKLVEEGELVAIPGNTDYEVSRGVSFPYAKPELRLFLERLGEQYRSACGESLVVTSLTRPISKQPGNAHPLSVHPAGMAVDFRISRQAACRGWLEQALLSLEKDQLLDVTRERNPPHYHVAVFPVEYLAYVARQEAAAEAKAAPAEPAAEEKPLAATRSAGWDSDGLARFALVVALSVALVFALGTSGGNRRNVGF
ncbi:MAG: hypothetical protein KY464_14235 [Gemmatimonadetes bacterium]|nr:hypothetical protein [Gemmatimonadota bacterium]